MHSTRLVLISCILGASTLGGCASVISGRHADVTINSSPPAAHVAIRNEAGQVVASGRTPTKVSLKRGGGLFKKPPRYMVTLQKPGYETTRIPIRPKLNPWVFGNVALGGFIGLAADSTTGAMWQPSPNKIARQLQPMQGPVYGQSRREEVTQVSYASDMPPE